MGQAEIIKFINENPQERFRAKQISKNINICETAAGTNLRKLRNERIKDIDFEYMEGDYTPYYEYFSLQYKGDING